MAEQTTEKDLLALETERLIAAARDSLSDEMVTRLAGTATDAIDLIDRVNRSGMTNAIPAIADLVNNGDLDRITRLARLYASAEDALTDEMIGRLAETAAEGMSLLDRLNRGGAGRLVEMLAHMEASGSLQRIADTLPRLVDRLETLERVVHAFEAAGAAAAKAPKSAGGVGGLWGLMRDPDNQDALRYLIEVGKALRAVSPP
jgi:uncharacterized protein YjgD (DUF1641 family)